MGRRVSTQLNEVQFIEIRNDQIQPLTAMSTTRKCAILFLYKEYIQNGRLRAENHGSRDKKKHARAAYNVKRGRASASLIAWYPPAIPRFPDAVGHCWCRQNWPTAEARAADWAGTISIRRILKKVVQSFYFIHAFDGRGTFIVKKAVPRHENTRLLERNRLESSHMTSIARTQPPGILQCDPLRRIPGGCVQAIECYHGARPMVLGMMFPNRTW